MDTCLDGQGESRYHLRNILLLGIALKIDCDVQSHAIASELFYYIFKHFPLV